MSSKGKFALGIAVVLHHIGRPRNSTINQKDKTTQERLRMSEGFSSGGSLRPVVGVAVAVAVVLLVASFSLGRATARLGCGSMLVSPVEAAGGAFELFAMST